MDFVLNLEEKFCFTFISTSFDAHTMIRSSIYTTVAMDINRWISTTVFEPK